MAWYLNRDGAAIAAALAAPLVVVAVLLPFRASWSNTNVALLLVVTVVAVAALGNRVAGALAAVSAAAWFDFSSPGRSSGSRSPSRRMSRLPSCCCCCWWAWPCLSWLPAPGACR